MQVNADAVNSATRGLIGDTSFAVLPQISKEHTFYLTFFFQLVSKATQIFPSSLSTP